MSERKETGLTPGQIAVSLGYRAAYFRSAEGGWRDDTADLLEAAAACIADMYTAFEPVRRGASEADYYCPDDVADDHTVLISFTIAELRAARSALLLANTGGTGNG